jgi:crossover junction endodeoxyribonuclease RusA
MVEQVLSTCFSGCLASAEAGAKQSQSQSQISLSPPIPTSPTSTREPRVDMDGRTSMTTLAGLCHWRQNRADVQNDCPSHFAYHFGSVCPYEAMDAFLAGEPDPRDLVAEWRVDISTALKPNGSVPVSLNDRPGNPFALAAAKDRVKARVRNAVRDAEVPQLKYAHVELHYRPKTNAHRDPDNLVATLKPAIDALHQVDERSLWDGILVDDDPRYLSWSPPMIHRAVRGQAPALWLLLRTASVV